MPIDQLQRLVDRQAIVDVIHAYCRNVDLVRPDELQKLFTDECVVDYGPGLGSPTHGAAEIAARLARGLSKFAATSHHVSNIEVTFDDPTDGATVSDTANTITYLYAWHRYEGDQPDALLLARYHDRFVRVGDSWRIAERVLRVAGQQNFDVAWYPIGRQA